jgi:hypothetical protein
MLSDWRTLREIVTVFDAIWCRAPRRRLAAYLVIEHMLIRLYILVVAFTLIAGCAWQTQHTVPVGSSVNAAGKQLGIQLSSWQPAAAPGYDMACALDQPVTMYGEQGRVCVVRQGDTVAAFGLHVDGCDGSCYDALRAKVVADFGVTDGADRDVFVVQRRGVVHLRPTTDGGAELVVTDSTYGDFYVKRQLHKGFVDLSNGIRSH